MTEGYDRKPLRIHPEELVVADLRTSDTEDGSRWNREQKLVRPPLVGLWSVYLDGSLSPKGPLRDVVENWLSNADMAVFKHPHRTCAYAEIDACVARGKITPDEGMRARGTMMLSGFPRDYGLWALGMVARRVHANGLQSIVMPLTWAMTQHIVRDQIWFPFVLWKVKNAMNRLRTIDANIFDNDFFSFRRHGT